MLRLGNTNANKIYEENVPKDMESFRITPSSSRYIYKEKKKGKETINLHVYIYVEMNVIYG